MFQRLWENFRKTDKLSLKTLFCENKTKTLPQNFGKSLMVNSWFMANFRQTVGDSYLNKYPTMDDTAKRGG